MKVFRDSIHGDIELAEHEMRVVHTSGFQRLHGCRRLGLTYLVYPAAKHTRFEHVLGVMHIATRIAARLKHLQDQRLVFEGSGGRHLVDVLRLSALLHDIAHVPFGHTLEDEMPQIPEHGLYHPKKCAADAMLIRAASDLRLDEDSLMQLSDDGLLDRYRDHVLIAMLRRRRLFKPVFVCRWEHIHSYDDKKDKREKIGDLRENHALRKRIEKRIVRELGLPNDHPRVLIFCPDPKMSLKLIRVLVHWKDGTIQRLNEIVRPDDPLTVDQVSVLQEIYPELWKLYLFVDPSLRSMGHKIRQRFCELLKVELGLDATCDPAYEHYLETTCEDYRMGLRLDKELENTDTFLKFSESRRSKIWSECHAKLPLGRYDEDFADVVEVASRRDDEAVSGALQEIIRSVLNRHARSKPSRRPKPGL
jgi:HD domain-containing protein